MEKIHSRQEIFELFEMLNAANIRYLLIKNINNELPDNLKIGKDIDFIVAHDDCPNVITLLAENGYNRILHPNSVEAGWRLLYGAEDCVKFINADLIEVDIHTSLCVKSSMMNGWVPLDKKINADMWQFKFWDEKLLCWRINDRIAFVYEIARCIFDKAAFNEAYIQEIEKNKSLLDAQDVIDYMHLVFFKFTEKLRTLIKEGRYHQIVDEYYHFMDY